MARTADRGYGNAHQQLRRQWKPKVDRGEVNCARCGKRIVPGTPWDLGHQDQDRSIYTGPEHSKCNRGTAAHKAARKAAQSGQRRQYSRRW